MAVGPGRIAGIASIFVDGVPMTAKGGLEYKTNTTKRTVINGMDGSFAGWMEEGDAPYIKVTLLDTGTFPIQSLFDNTNIQVIANLANGRVVTGHSMTIMESIEVKNEDATFDITFVGISVTASARAA